MVTIVTKTISLTGTPDYSTLQAWEDAAPANLVTADQVWKGVIDKATDNFVGDGNSSYLTIGGSTVDSTRYKELTTNTGASFRDHANKLSNVLSFSTSNGCSISVPIDNVGGANAPIKNTESYFRLSNIQINSGMSATILSMVSGGEKRFANLICEQTSASNVVEAFDGHRVTNCVFILRNSTTTPLWQGGISTGQNDFHNCTFVKPSNFTKSTNIIGVGNAGHTHNATNCAYYGGNNVTTGAATTSFTNCKSEDTTPPSGVTTVSFVNAKFVVGTDSARDFKIQSGSGLIDVGATDTTWASTDILGTARPTGASYDVGAYEYQAAATSVTINPSGNVTFSGSAILTVVTTTIITPSGNITFSGNSTLYKGRIIIPTGNIVFNGTAPFGTPTTSIMSPGGSLVFSGSASIAFQDYIVISPTGLIVFSGSAPITFSGPPSHIITPTGSIVFQGTAPLGPPNTSILTSGGTLVFSSNNVFIKNHVMVTTGNIVFNSVYNILYFNLTLNRYRTIMGVGT